MSESRTIRHEDGPLFPAQKDKRMGYINSAGQWVIPPVLIKAGDFHGDVAVAATETGTGLIDREGRFRLPPEYDLILFSDDMFLVRTNLPKGKMLNGYANTSGDLVVPLQYPVAFQFQKGYARVARAMEANDSSAQWYLIDHTGAEMPWEDTRLHSRDTKSGIIDKARYDYVCGPAHGVTQVAVINPEKKRKDPDALRWTESGYNIAFAAAEAWGDWGLLDATGKEIVAPQYDRMGAFSEGLFVVGKDGKHGYMTTAGKLQIPLQFEEAWSFYNGRARVKRNGRWGVIDGKGDFVIPADFDDLIGTRSWERRYSEKTWFLDGLAPACKGGKWGFIDETGKWVIEPRYDDVRDFVEGFAAVMRRLSDEPDPKTTKRMKQETRSLISNVDSRDAVKKLLKQYLEAQWRRFGNNRWGFINKEGVEIVPCSHLAVGDFHNGMARVTEGYVDTTGKSIRPRKK